ncbi:DMT family transporter [Kiloniella sp.]|uniref:DMT family transporter n=1 Tax=Kiloniella sp. TaxID=1938587 RepID=UPI003B01320C
MQAWIYFILLSVFAWGPSFYFIKISLRELEPFNIVAWRFSLGLVVLCAMSVLSRVTFPKDKKSLFHLIILGLINTALPLTLITMAGKEVDSVIAGAIHGSIPLFTMIIAALAISNEQLTGPKLLGCLFGFAGLMVLLSENVSFSGITITGQWYGTIILITAALSNAIGAVYSRLTMEGVHPICLATASMASATIIMWAAVGISDEQFTLPVLLSTHVSLFWMGAIGSALAYYMFFYLIQTWGAGKATMVAYVIPVTAIIIGIVLLDEILTWRITIGTGLILLGVYSAIHVKKIGLLRKA